MSRLLIIPAAGSGSRLGADVPKVLVRVDGMTLLERLLMLYRRWVDHVIVVVNPAFEALVLQHVRDGPDAERLTLLQQREPTGMLDAILLGTTTAARVQPSSVWVTWCDQVAVHPRTIERLAARTATASDASIVMPTVMQPRPYIHLERDAEGRIVRVLHRREGDPMPEVGESDMGLFALSRTTYLDRLPAYAEQVEIGRTTGERNFLPFIPWLARTETIVTFGAENPMEAIGINTPQDLREVEQYLRSLSPEP